VTRLRRDLVVMALAVATALTLAATPAQAAFNDTASTTLTVGTARVAAPTKLQVKATCDTWTLYATGSWRASTSPRVSGYRITAYAANGQVIEVFDVDAGTTSYSISASRDYATYGIRVTVTTVTGYGWTAESEKTGTITC
jgi:hypothetical protein